MYSGLQSTQPGRTLVKEQERAEDACHGHLENEYAINDRSRKACPKGLSQHHKGMMCYDRGRIQFSMLPQNCSNCQTILATL